jgi:hypothetical protein
MIQPIRSYQTANTMQALDRYVERVPHDPIRQRYRIADGGLALGLQLAQASQAVEPYRFSPTRH